MPDLAELQLIIRSEQVVIAKIRLDGFTLSGKNAEGQSDALSRSNKRLEGSFSSLQSMMLKLLAGFSVWSTLKFAVQQAAQVETLTSSFEYLTKSASQAKTIMAGLQDFSIKSGIPVTELGKSAQYLLAMRFSAEELVPTMKTITNAVKATGGGAEKINDLAYALGQMKARGSVSAQEMNQLANANVNAWGFLAEAIGKTIPEAMDAAEKKQIEGSAAVKAILQGLAREFPNAAETLAQKTQGTWNRLVATVTQKAGEMGMGIIKAFNVNENLNGLIDLVDKLANRAGVFITQWLPMIKTVAELVVVFLSLYGVSLLVSYGIAAITAAFTVLTAHPIIAVITGLIALFLYFKDMVIDLGDESVTVADLVRATASVLWEELLKDLTFLADKVKGFFTWLSNVAKVSFLALAFSTKSVLENMGINWDVLWLAMKETVKTIANYTIAAIVSIGDTLAVMTNRMLKFISAVSSLDFTHGPEKFALSLGLVALQLRSALDPTTVWQEVKGKWTGNFATDWLGVMKGIGSMGARNMKDAFVAAMGGPESWVGSWVSGAESMIDKIKDRAKQYSTARKATTMPSAPTTAPAPGGIDPIKLLEDKDKDKADKLAKYNEKIADMLYDLDKERVMIGKSADERERMTKIWELQELAQKAQITDQETVNRLIDQYNTKLIQVQKIRNTFEKIEGIGKDIGTAVGDSMEAAILKTKDLRSAVEDLALSIQRALVQRLFTQPIAEGIAGIITTIAAGAAGAAAGSAGAGGAAGRSNPSGISGAGAPTFWEVNAMGNIYSNGRLIPFAKGGLFNGPTVFPLRGGAAGLAGEDGPEAAMPLVRTRSGHLGVRTGGGGGKVINVTQHVHTNDANSFKRSSRQITQGLRDMMGRE